MEPQCHTQFHLGAEWSQRRQCVKGRYFQRKNYRLGKCSAKEEYFEGVLYLRTTKSDSFEKEILII